MTKIIRQQLKRNWMFWGHMKILLFLS